MKMDGLESYVSVSVESYEPTYAEAFPPLCDGSTNGLDSAPTQWGQQTPTKVVPAMALKSSRVTQVFIIPQEERRYQNEDLFGDRKAQNSIVSDIMTKHDVLIEMSVAKDHSLSVIIAGKVDAVMRARKDFTQQLQQQGTVKISIPKEHHRYIIGRGNKIREQLEIETATRIRLPRQDENSDLVEITGTKEGIERARMAIQLKSDEQSKLAVVRLPIPKIYHPFILGPNGSLVKEMVASYGGEVRIFVPPIIQVDEVVVISGEKEGVAQVERNIRTIYENKAKNCTTVRVEVPKTQHKYLVGPRSCNLALILAETGVWVEVPPIDSPSGTVTLRGEALQLGIAMTLVHTKANSMVIERMEVEGWLHRFIIGPKGASIREINEEWPKVHIELMDSENSITLEGPPEDVVKAEMAIRAKVDDLVSRMAYVELEINQKFHKNIIGKNGSNISRIRKETGVNIKVPSDDSNSSVIRVEGSPEAVSKVKQELMEMALKLENEKCKDILIDYNLHKLIIGTQGARIREVREKFNQVQISFPDASQQSDVVQLRGQKPDVDQCYKYMQTLVAELAANNYKSEVHVFKDFHRNIIGKGGSKIKKIREETDTKIDLPRENSMSDVIIITGKKENVEKAKKLIQKIQTEMANVKDETIEIAQRLHQGLIGAKGKLIKSISDDCGGVQIRFPNENVKSDKVHLNGPKEDVDKAIKMLKELATEKMELAYTAEVRTKSINHGYLIGAGGTSINKLKESLGVRFSFAHPKDADPELITIIGRKEDVEKAKVELETRIIGLENVVELAIDVDPKHHRHFIVRKAEVVNKITNECGGISISFPKSGVKSSIVMLKGAKECVEAGKERIEKEVAELETQVSIEVVIAQKYHGNIMGARGYKIQDITRQFNVNIKLPERRPEPAARVPNGDVEEATMTDGNCLSTTTDDSDDQRPPPSDIITVSGQPENCEAAKEAMLELVPVVETMEIPHEFHGQIIGSKGAFIRQIQNDFGVNLMVPPQSERNDWIKISGPPGALPAVKEELMKKVKTIEDDRKDRELKSFTIDLVVPRKYHNTLIGKRGASINQIRDQYDVNIQFPEKNASTTNGGVEDGEGDGDVVDPADVVVIRGYEKNATYARDWIVAKVAELESLHTEEVQIDRRCHPRLIGARGRSMIKIMDDFKVDIKFGVSVEEPDLVVIVGQEDNVYDCRDHLFSLEEEYLQDIEEREEKRPAKSNLNTFFNFSNGSTHDSNQGERQKGFVVRDAPWCQSPPEHTIEEFPDLAPPANLDAPGVLFTSAWGPQKKI